MSRVLVFASRRHRRARATRLAEVPARGCAMRSVLEVLRQFADDYQCDLAELVQRQGDEHFGTLPPRYRRLAAQVWLQLPDEWDSHADWEIIVAEIPSLIGEVHLAGAKLDESEDGDLQRWTIVLCTSELDTRPDDEIINTIAHELAHVASGLPSDPRVRDTQLCENRANQIMRWWGFE